LIADYIRRRYNNLYFGDLHAKHGMWDEAFALYNGLDRAEKMRPLDADDRGEVEKLISAFSAALHSVAAKGTEAVKRFFVNCCNALGFEEVTFWRREIDWQQRSVNGLNQYLIVFNQYLIDAVLRTLPKSGSVPPGVIPLTQPWERHAVAASLQTYNPDYLGAVIVSDEMVISRERRQLIETLLKHFVEAHSQALTVEKDQIKLEMRNRQVEIINSIFQAMGAEVRDAMQVFKMAAIGLRSLGYRRVLFCLVDPKVQKIQGVLDYSDNISVDVAKMTDYSLANPHIDIQPYVIATRRPAIIEDAANHPLTNKNAVQQTGMKALAIVPILNQFEEAIGTIHIERDDAAVPSREEVQDFIAFGRQLATAIEQSERVNLLQSALDKIPDPVVIVDSLERVRYANMPAGDLFRTKTGWSYRNEAGELRHRRGSPLRQYIREALTGIRDAHNVLGIGQDDEYRGQAICDYIKDWRTEIIGALMHITPINYLYKVLEAFRVLATANDLDSAMQAMLDAARILGHKWGRLYLLDEDDPSRLVSKFSFGMENAEEAEHFNSGKVILPRQDDTTMSWKSIDERMPIVFHWNPSLSDHTYTTKHGLEAVVISQPYEPALQGKKPGDFWIAFPLLTPEETLGKVSLQCDPDLRPEQYEMLKVLYEMAVGLWDAFLRRDRKAYDREQVIIEAAEKSMASIAHNLGSRLAPLDVLHSRYQAVSNGSQQLNDLNDDFARIIKHTLTIINRTKDLIYTVVPSYSQFDLIEMIRSALTTGLADQHLAINCAHPEVAIKADNELLTGALLELLQNSKEAIVMPADLRVTVDLLSVRRQTQNWVRIEYTDNGPGVKGELKKRIFDDFFSQRTGRKNGTGLGLGYVRRIVKAHGGTIKERGKYGSGAKFVIELPQSN
jgi:signal transduction histidine kinase/GAF domain-containing protein